MTEPQMTHEEVLALPATVDLVTAGRALGVKRSQCYELARRQEFPCPVLRVGRRYVVPRVQIFRTLGMSEDGTQAPAPDPVSALIRLDRRLNAAEVAALETAVALVAKALVRSLVEQMNPPVKPLNGR